MPCIQPTKNLFINKIQSTDVGCRLFAFRFRIRFSLHNRVSVEYTSLTRIFIRNASCRKYVSITEEIVGTTNWILYFLGWQYITQLVPIMDNIIL